MENAKRNGGNRQDVAKPARSIDLSTVTGRAFVKEFSATKAGPNSGRLLRVLHLGFLQDGNVRVGDFPESKAIRTQWMRCEYAQS